MSRLPRVAVLGGGAASAATIIALIDGGLETTGLTSSAPSAEAVSMLRGFGAADRLRTVGQAGPAGGTEAGGGFVLFPTAGVHPPFALAAGGTRLGSWDAVVFAGAPVTMAEGVDVPAVAEAVRSAGRECFGGVFHPDVEGLFWVDGDSAVAAEQGRWIGEYLRGRYLLPARSVMVSGRGPLGRAGGARRGWAWRIALRRELRRGHERAALAGYPLPVPSRLP